MCPPQRASAEKGDYLSKYTHMPSPAQTWHPHEETAWLPPKASQLLSSGQEQQTRRTITLPPTGSNPLTGFAISEIMTATDPRVGQ